MNDTRTQVFNELYKSLEINEGEKSIYSLIMGSERKDMWNIYLDNLFNDGYDISQDSSMLDIR